MTSEPRVKRKSLLRLIGIKVHLKKVSDVSGGVRKGSFLQETPLQNRSRSSFQILTVVQEPLFIE